MAEEGAQHMLKRYNLRPRPTCKKKVLTAVSCSSPAKCKWSSYTSYPHTHHDQKACCRRDSIPYLSPEIIFNILVFLPADILYNVMRYVCREWYNIISSPNFIDAHLLKTDRGLLIKHPLIESMHYVEIVKNIDTIQIAERGHSNMDRCGMSSCNGLLYMANLNIRCVANLVTKEVVTLPFSEGMPDISFTSMGYTRSKKYKLVEFYIQHKFILACRILTLGVDTEWRSLFKLSKPSETENFDQSDFHYSKPIVSAEGILHVIHRTLPLVFNIDLETETFYIRVIPKCSGINRKYMGTGRSLCFMDYLGKFSWELWLLKDAETGEWTKLAIIDLQGQILQHTFCQRRFKIEPVGFLKDGEIAVFQAVQKNRIPSYDVHATHPSRNCIIYNVKTGGINSCHLDKIDCYLMDEPWRYIPHVKSLVSLKFGATT